MQAELERRLVAVRSHVLTGCPTCRVAPSIVILWPGDPEPPASCPGCGRPLTGTTRVRFVQLDRGPA